MVEDKISSSVPVSLETAIITFARIERTKDPTVFFLVTDKPDRRVKVTVGVSGGTVNMREEQIENPKRRIPTRIGISLNGKVTAGRIVLTYEVAQ
jgi:hypothetical protein